ncbi:MAG: hypothetical protein P8Y05_08925 [Deinococcales bacterium]
MSRAGRALTGAPATLGAARARRGPTRFSTTVAGQSGAVAAIDLRYTELTTDGQRVLMPNQTIFTRAVVTTRAAPPTGPTASGPSPSAS